jgi:3-oxoadipate enol-lactonase
MRETGSERRYDIGHSGDWQPTGFCPATASKRNGPMQHIAVPNGTISVQAQGKGIPVLFVHGFPVSHAMWKAQISGLAGKCRAIAPDLRGFGESAVTPGKVTMEDHADDMHGLLHAAFVDEPVVFCGLSMGGYIAWPFFQKYRDQLRALILCDTRAEADTPEAAAGRRQLAERVLAEGPGVAADAILSRVISPMTTERHPEVFADLRTMVMHNKPAGIAAALHGLAERPDCTELLPTIDVPTLVICGQEDQITPPAGMRKLAEAIPGAQYVEIPGCGHVPSMENADAFNSAISRFLGSLSR